MLLEIRVDDGEEIFSRQLRAKKLSHRHTSVVQSEQQEGWILCGIGQWKQEPEYQSWFNDWDVSCQHSRKKHSGNETVNIITNIPWNYSISQTFWYLKVTVIGSGSDQSDYDAGPIFHKQCSLHWINPFTFQSLHMYKEDMVIYNS